MLHIFFHWNLYQRRQGPYVLWINKKSKQKDLVAKVLAHGELILLLSCFFFCGLV